MTALLSSAALTAAPALLVFNPGAGGSSETSPPALLAGLRSLGHPDVTCLEAGDDLAGQLAGVSGTVYVAGGDGTVRRVACALAGRPGVVLAPIPLGTANNVARSLDLEGRPQEILERYRHARPAPLDLGRVRAPWGEDLFLEACGCGAFAHALAEYGPEEGKSPLRAVQALVRTLGGFTPLPLALEVDGETQPAAPLALLEIMNARATGPRLQLAPQADLGDGRLNVVQIDAEKLDGALAYLAALARGTLAELPSVESHTAGQIDIPYLGQVFHVDDQVRPAQPGATGTVSVSLWAGALQVLRPEPEA